MLKLMTGKAESRLATRGKATTSLFSAQGASGELLSMGGCSSTEMVNDERTLGRSTSSYG